MEIISLHKRCNKTGTNAATKAPSSGYHLFLREQLDEMTEEDRKNYRSIVSRRWKEIKEDLARLSPYNHRARKMRDDNPLVSNIEQQTIIERQLKKNTKNPRVCWIRWFRPWGMRWSGGKEACSKKNIDIAQKSTKTPDEEPVAKQPLELTEPEPEDPGDSYLKINLKHDTEKYYQSKVQPGLWYTEVKHYSSR